MAQPGFAATEGSGVQFAADQFGTAASPSTNQLTPYNVIATGTPGAVAPVSLTNPHIMAAALDWIQVTPVLDTNIYANNELLFDVTTITNAATATGRATELVSCIVTDEDEQSQAIDLYITNLSTSWGTFNAAVAATDAMSRGIQAYIPIAAADFKDIGGATVAMPTTSKNIGVVCETSGSADLYIVGILRSGTPTYTASGLRISLGFRRN